MILEILFHNTGTHSFASIPHFQKSLVTNPISYTGIFQLNNVTSWEIQIVAAFSVQDRKALLGDVEDTVLKMIGDMKVVAA